MGNTKQDSSLVDERGYKGYVKENSNKSSFSLPTANWREYIEDNFKATGTRTNLEDIKEPIKQKVKDK